MMSDSQQPDPNLGYPDRETRNFDILGGLDVFGSEFSNEGGFLGG